MRKPLNLVGRQIGKATQSAVPRKYLLGSLDVVLTAQHLTYLEIELLGLLSRSQLSEALIFATIRDPYARAVSSVGHFAHRFADEYTLDAKPTPAQIERALEFWQSLDSEDHNVRAHRRAQSDFLVDRDGKLVTDRLMRLENLQADFAALCGDLGIAGVDLPHTGKGRVGGALEQLYTARSRRLVEQMFSRDFELLDYRTHGA